MRKFNRLIKAVIYYLRVIITGQQNTNILSIRDIHFPPDYIFNAFIDAGHKAGLRVYAGFNTFCGGHESGLGTNGVLFRDPEMAKQDRKSVV